jgi:Glycosyltransferase
MKVMLVSQYFYPEQFKCNDVAFDLVKRGYEVTVATGIPNYPDGKFFNGYGIFKRRKEKINGVNVIRIPLVPRGKGRGFEIAINGFSWALIASVWAFFHALRNKYDYVLVHESSPVTQAFPATVIKKMQRIPFYFWVLDLWPESLTSAGGVTNKYILGFFTSIVRFLYKQSDKILISSKGFKHSICAKGNFADKVVYFPNWAEDVIGTELSSYEIPQLPDGFKVMFAGNIGEAQDFEHILAAAHKLKDNKEIIWIILGSGRKKEWVINYIKENGLQDTVHLMGSYPVDAMPAFFSKADVMLVSLKDELIFNLTVPAKLQAYMAAGKPVVAMLNGDAAQLVDEAKCGLASSAGNSDGLVHNILQLKDMNKDELASLGMNGREFYKKYFDKTRCIDHLCELLSE